MEQAQSHANGTGAAGRRRWIGRSGPLEFVGLSVMGLFLAAFEAFDVGPQLPLGSVIYWQGAMLGGGVIAAAIEPFVYRRLAERPSVFALTQTLAMTPPITLWIWVWSNLVHRGDWSPVTLPMFMASVLVVNAAVVTLAWLLRTALARRDAREPTSSDERAPPPAIRAKLPPRLARARLIAVQAEDHYLRIHTEAGSDLILMRLSDALEALKAHDGLQVHRSWWVARPAVEATRWKKGRGALTLAGGLVVPVSETFAPIVRATDWA